MLKEIVDETSHGKYDFMYLRIGKSPFPRPPQNITVMEANPQQISRTTASQFTLSLFFSNSIAYQTSHHSVGYAFINFEDVSLTLQLLICNFCANFGQPIDIIDVSLFWLSTVAKFPVSC